jgi:hypothetical protein
LWLRLFLTIKKHKNILRKNLVDFVQRIKYLTNSFNNESLVKDILKMEGDLLRSQNFRKESLILKPVFSWKIYL